MILVDQKTAARTESEWLRCLIADALVHHHPFCLWKTPGKDEKNLIISVGGVKLVKEVSLEDSDPGFLLAPFQSESDKVFFPADLLYRFEGGNLISKIPDHLTQPSESARLNFYQKAENSNKMGTDFKALVKKSIHAIDQGLFEKVVPSRFKDVPLQNEYPVLSIFEKLCHKHPHALVSLVSSPITGTWLGASPELLVSVSQNKFKTVALAGTLPYTPDVDLKKVAWTQKEIEEQAFVCRYIINCFKKIRLRDYEEHGPKTTVAGNLMHLKTEYEVDLLNANFPQLGSVMLKLLHPTSAVCGMPLEPAQKFLLEHEGYDREFYSGFQGPINLKSESLLYVNLRCLQLLPGVARCYAGAGVTADSVPELEWNETEMKLENLYPILVQ
mgnify:CR=1 FL=1